jgi:hypothetical protein
MRWMIPGHTSSLQSFTLNSLSFLSAPLTRFPSSDVHMILPSSLDRYRGKMLDASFVNRDKEIADRVHSTFVGV